MGGGENRDGRRKPGLEVVRGGILLRKRVAGWLYGAPLNGFFQVNLAMASRITAHLAEVLESRLLPPGKDLPGGGAPPVRPVRRGGPVRAAPRGQWIPGALRGQR